MAIKKSDESVLFKTIDASNNGNCNYSQDIMFEMVMDPNNIPILFSLDLSRFEYAIKIVYQDTYRNGKDLIRFIKIEDYTNFIANQMINNADIDVVDLGKKLEIMTKYVFSNR